MRGRTRINLAVAMAFVLFAFLSLLGGAQETQQPAEAQTQAPAAPQPQGPQDPVEFEAFIDGIMAGHLQAYHMAGATFCFVKDGSLFLAKGYGLADVDAGKPVRAEETLFRIASVSKLFTWTAVMQLVEQGRLDLEADVNSYLKDFQVPATYAKPVTLSLLMAHAAGFEDRAAGIGTLDPDRVVPLEDFLRENIPRRIFPPGVWSAYSNYSTALAGYIVEKVSGLAFEEYVEQFIFEPLAMEHSSFRQPLPAGLAPHLSKGYRFRRGVYEPESFEYISGIVPAGAMSATSPDMARFMIAHLQNGLYEGRRILGEETARLMHARHFGGDPRTSGNAHGFWEGRTNGIRWLFHGGDTLLFHSYLILIPETKEGLFVAYNTATGVGPARLELVQAFFDRYHPAVPTKEEPAADRSFVSRADPFLGTYGFTRTAASNFEKLQNLALNVRITVTENGTLLTRVPMLFRDRQWREVSPQVFREVGGHDLLVFQKDSLGRVRSAFLDSMPLLAFVKLAWHESPSLHLAFLAAAALLFLSTLTWPLAALFRWACRRAKTEVRTHWIIRLPAFLMSVLFLAFLVALALSLSRPEEVLEGVPPLLASAMILPIIAILFVVLSAVASYLAWKFKYWTFCGRLFYSLIVLSGVLFLVFLKYWNLLGLNP